MKKKKKKKSRWFSNLLIFLLFVVGAGILLYPTFSDMWNKYRNAQLITQYTEAIETLPEETFDELWAEAREYNAKHTVNQIVDAFDEETAENGEETEKEIDEETKAKLKAAKEALDYYNSVLNPNGDGLMGSIDIPKLGVKIAIYHGLEEKVLEKGCGHVQGTGLPIGGESNHAALAAHRGLPSAKLFTDLDQIVEGDIFILNIMGEKLAYEVDQIKTVLPYETEDLAIVEGEDLVTLITCTPYGVNSHRLLVRGKRTEYVEEIKEIEESAGSVPDKIIEEVAQQDPLELLKIALIVFGVSVIIIFIVTRRKKSKKEANK